MSFVASEPTILTGYPGHIRPEPSDRYLNNFHFLVPSAVLDATFELSAPLLWKRVLRLADFGRFQAYDDDFQGFLKKRASPLAHRSLDRR